jgi:hypothetical protein
MELSRMGWCGVDASGSEQGLWLAILNTLMNLRVPSKGENI